MKTLLTSAALMFATLSECQTMTPTPYGLGNCSGDSAGVFLDLTDTNSVILNPDEAYLVSYHGAGDLFGLPIDTLALTNGEFHDSIPLPAIYISTSNPDSSHKVTLHYKKMDFMVFPPDTVDWQQSFFVSFVPMQCYITKECHGSILNTSGGEGTFFIGNNPLGAGSSVPLSEAGQITLMPLAVYTSRYDGWVSYTEYIDPIWVTSQTTPTCMDGPTGTATVMTDGVNGPYTYTWAGRTDTTATIVDLAAGFYNVTVTDAEGCSMSDDMEVLLDTCLITQVNEEVLAKLEVWPNPTSGNLNFSVEEYEEFYVMNPAGQTVMQGPLRGIGQIDVSALASGAYVIRLSDNKRLATARFVIER